MAVKRDGGMHSGLQPAALSGQVAERPRRRLVLHLICGAAVVVFAGYNVFELVRRNSVEPRFTPRRWVHLDEPKRPAQGTPPLGSPARSPLRVAVAPVISPEKSLQIYDGLVNYLARKLEREPEFLQRPTYAEVNDLVRYRQCDVALVCTYPFVRGEREFGMEVLVVPQIQGATTYHSLILVPRLSRAASFLDLRGRRFASADILSNSGWLFPVVWLKDHGEDADTFFSNQVITGSHDRSIVAVASGYVDGAAVDSLVYEQMLEEDPSLAEKTKIILKSPPFGMPPVVTSPAIDPTLRQQLLTVLLDMHNDPKGKEILSTLRIDRFVVPQPDLYDSVRQAASVLESHR